MYMHVSTVHNMRFNIISDQTDLTLYIICAGFFHIVHSYMYCCWKYSYQEGRAGVLLTSFTPPHLCACPKPGPKPPMS